MGNNRNGAAPVKAAGAAKRSKEFTVLDVEVDINQIMVPDLALLALFTPPPEGASGAVIKERQDALAEHIGDIVNFLQRVVVGGVDNIPSYAIPKLLEKISARMNESANEGN